MNEMATTLLEPRVRILRQEGRTVEAFEQQVSDWSNLIRGEVAGGSDNMKVTWLLDRQDELICIFEWCIWAQP